jgi:ankyrin repeat protein
MGHTAVVRALIMAGANVNALSRNGTPLHQAAARRHRRVVRLLIQKGADINIEDNQGHTFDQLTRDPIIIQCRALTDKLIGAVQRVDTAAVEKLLTRGASAISFDMQANTAIHSAIGTYNPERPTPLDTIARILVKTVGPAITLALNERGRTPLHNAVLQGNVRIAQLLLLNGAYTDVQDGDGNTPLHLATSSIMHQLLFLRYGANATIDNKEGKTPIHCNVELWQYGFSHLQ